MKSVRWRWLLMAVIPGCVLVQPLDGAVSSSDGDDSSSSAGAAGSKGSSHAGSGNSRAGSTGSPGGRAGAPGASGSPGSSGAPGTVGKVTPFIGTWTVTSGTLTISCPGLAPSNEPASGTETWAPGTTTDLVQPTFEGDCQFTANVNGLTATGQPGQSCMETSTDDTSGDVITQNLTFESYKFVVSSDGTTATQTFAGNDDYTDVTTGEHLSCLFDETAALSM